MLVETIVRFTLAVKDHRVVSVRHTRGELQIELDVKKRRTVPCSICGRRLRPKDRLSQRRWRHVSLWGIPTSLFYRPRRVNCPEHGIRVEQVPWSVEGNGGTLIVLLLLVSRRRNVRILDLGLSGLRNSESVECGSGKETGSQCKM